MAESASPAAASKPRKTVRYPSQQQSDRRRAKTRVNIGEAYARWTRVKDLHGIKTHAQMATFLLDRYEITGPSDPSTSTPSKRRKRRRLNPPALSSIAGSLSPLRGHQSGDSGEDTLSASETRSLEDSYEKSNIASTPVRPGCPKPTPQPLSTFAESLSERYIMTESTHQPEKQALESWPLTETCKSEDSENHFLSSPSETEQKTPASVQSSENETESGKKDTACQKLNCQDVQKTTNSENRDTEIRENKDEQFTASLSVGDGRYMVDLGSPSEFIIDEDCILQLFESCRKCMRQCTVRKQVKGLKLVVQQTCAFCQSCYKWTNLPDDDEGDIQINGQDEAHEQRNSAMSASSNTS